MSPSAIADLFVDVRGELAQQAAQVGRSALGTVVRQWRLAFASAGQDFLAGMLGEAFSHFGQKGSQARPEPFRSGGVRRR
ncbi:hypothetical protein D3C76_1641880 [compost metagenome]